MEASKTLKAPAKLNLTLEVLAPRADGLHGIRSVMVPIDLFDELHLDRSDVFAFACDMPELCEQNLVERALAAIGMSNVRARITLEKRIPTGAGMGGGSSDAASILLAAQGGAFGVLSEIDYLSAARSLGSDVPFFLVQTAALVEGTGERVTALGVVPAWYAIVLTPPVSVSTAWAYRQIDAAPRPSRPRNTAVSIELAQALQNADFSRVLECMQNDFHDIIVAAKPEIARALEVLQRAGAQRALLTGSGSSVFTLTQTKEQRDEIVKNVQVPTGYRMFACSFWNGEGWRSAA